MYLLFFVRARFPPEKDDTTSQLRTPTGMSNPLPTGNVQRGAPFSCYQLDPTQDQRWSEFVERHPKASIFHTVGWLKTLRHTYGYEPVVFTTSPPTCALKNGLVFCRIKSWLTGRRLVSLPFSDHCELLCDTTQDLIFLMRYLQSALEPQNCRYLEIRPVNGIPDQMGNQIRFSPSYNYFLHTLSL